MSVNLFTRYGLTAGTVAPPPPDWSPADLPSLALWLDADDATTITDAGAGAVSQWTSKDPLARTFSQATPASRPTTGVATQNGRNVIRFDTDFLISDDAASVWKFLHDGTEHVVYMVVKTGLVADPNAVYVLYGTDNGAAQIGASLWYDDRASSSRNEVVFHQVTRGASPVNTLNLTGSLYNDANVFSCLTVNGDADAATALRSRIRRNARDSFEGNTSTGAASASNPSGTLRIGASGLNNFVASMDVAEIIMCDAPLSEENEAYVVGYLGARWGLPMVTKWNAESGTDQVVATAYGWPSIVLDGSTYVLYNHHTDDTIHRYTSSDGITWTTTGQVLAGAAGWENNRVGVPQVWKEGATWYMIYRGDGELGNDSVGLATSSDGITWTKEATNPVIANASWAVNAEMTGIIKVGSTYYGWVETGFDQGRQMGLYTSTDLVTWTADAANPIFTNAGGGCFCGHVFKHGGYYWMVLPRYNALTTTHGILELWRDTNPTFYVADREYMGVVWDSRDLGSTWRPADVPHVMTTDVTRDTLVGGKLTLYFASGAGSYDGTYRTEIADVDAALGL